MSERTDPNSGGLAVADAPAVGVNETIQADTEARAPSKPTLERAADAMDRAVTMTEDARYAVEEALSAADKAERPSDRADDMDRRMDRVDRALECIEVLTAKVGTRLHALNEKPEPTVDRTEFDTRPIRWWGVIPLPNVAIGEWFRCQTIIRFHTDDNNYRKRTWLVHNWPLVTGRVVNVTSDVADFYGSLLSVDKDSLKIVRLGDTVTTVVELSDVRSVNDIVPVPNPEPAAV